jgi:hypothetical protein
MCSLRATEIVCCVILAAVVLLGVVAVIGHL